MGGCVQRCATSARAVVLAHAGAAIAVCAGPSGAGDGPLRSEDGVVLAPGGMTDDEFGSSVAAGDGVLVVGAPNRRVGSSQFRGAAFLFQDPLGVLPGVPLTTPDDLSTADRFGFSVATGNGLIAVGRPGYNNSSFVEFGAVELFDALGGVHLGRVVSPVTRGEFGVSVALDGDLLAVGAFRSGLAGNQAGAVFVFDISAAPFFVPEVARLTAFDAAPVDQLGTAVDISGELVIAGAPLDDPGGAISAGSARLFAPLAPGGPIEYPALTAPDGASGDRFGTAVAIDGDLALVGAPGVNGGQGAAYVFDVSNPMQPVLSVTIRPATPGTPGEFGRAVAIDGTTAIVGAPTASTPGGVQAGHAVAFDLADPTRPLAMGRLTGAGVRNGNEGGAAVAVDRGRAFVGAPENFNPNGLRAGVVHGFVLPACAGDWDASGSVDIFDVLGFLENWSAGDTGADLDLSGDLGIFDILEFLARFSAGCDTGDG